MDLNKVNEVSEIQYSVVVPVYNEEESLPGLFEEIFSVMKNLGGSYEVIFVDDCSSDQSPVILQQMKSVYNGVIQPLRLQKRGGQTKAMRKGLDFARGRVIITLDADFQNDPADIPALLSKLNEGHDMVCG
jgi:dolichol-phosphate mannosyltransferase